MLPSCRPGSGTVFEDERFKKLLMVKYVDENQDLQMEVLYALRITVAKTCPLRANSFLHCLRPTALEVM